MRNGTKDLLTGLAGIAALAGLATLLLAYGELPRWGDATWRLDVRLDDGGGLRAGSQVTLNGVPIGEIATVALAPDDAHPDRPVLAEARIDEPVRLPATVVAEVETSLVGSGAKLVLRLPPPDAASDVPPDAKVPDLPVTPPPVIEGRSRSLTGMIEEMIEPRLAGLDAGVEDLRAMARTYTRLGEHLDDLVKPIDPSDPEAEGNLRTTVERVNATLTDARGAIASASAWLGDEQLRQDVRTAVWRAGVVLEQAVKAVDEYAALARSLGGDADEAVSILDDRTAEVVAAVVPVAERASVLLERLGELARLAAEGDGTVGRLLTSPDLHESLRETARQLEQTLRKAGLLLDKIRDEGLGVSFD